MVTDLAEVRRLGRAKQAENLRFRRYLAARRRSEEPFYVVAGEVERRMDCTACANCCRTGLVTVIPDEIAAIAAYLKMQPAEVERLYTQADPKVPEGRLLRTGPDGCVFLQGNLCMVYEARPRPCRDFPNVSYRARSLGSRMSSLCRWVPFCPIVYNALEEYKKVTGFHPRRR